MIMDMMGMSLDRFAARRGWLKDADLTMVAVLVMKEGDWQWCNLEATVVKMLVGFGANPYERMTTTLWSKGSMLEHIEYEIRRPETESIFKDKQFQIEFRRELIRRRTAYNWQWLLFTLRWRRALFRWWERATHKLHEQPAAQEYEDDMNAAYAALAVAMKNL